jgi:hypothetical protein
MIKSFTQFINENEQPEFLTKLKRLRELGLIGHDEYLQDLVTMAKEEGRDPLELLEPGDILFDITPDEYLDDDQLDPAKEWLLDWQGRKGERIIMATGKLEEEGFDLDLVLSSGARVHFYWGDRDVWGPDWNTIRDGGREWSLSEKVWLRLTDEFYDVHDDWEQYMHSLLWATVELSY